jgi:hypothetical protein
VGTGCQHYASSRLEAAGRAKLSKGAAALWGAIGAAVISRCSGMPAAGTSRSHDISDLCVTAVTFLVIQSFMVTFCAVTLRLLMAGYLTVSCGQASDRGLTVRLNRSRRTLGS